jgi:hypothetical protein
LHDKVADSAIIIAAGKTAVKQEKNLEVYAAAPEDIRSLCTPGSNRC